VSSSTADSGLAGIAATFGATRGALHAVAEALPLAGATEIQLWPEHFDIVIGHGN
jgi:hypothetical protein